MCQRLGLMKPKDHGKGFSHIKWKILSNRITSLKIENGYSRMTT